MSARQVTLMQRLAYVATCAALILSQTALSWALHRQYAATESPALALWLTPLRDSLDIFGLPMLAAIGVMAYGLLVAGALAWLSFRLARRLEFGTRLALLSVVPVVQLVAIPALATLSQREPALEYSQSILTIHRRVVIGLLAGVAIIVLAVLVSAVTFGAYGWDLFVATPFLVGVTTGYLVNYDEDLEVGRTMWLCLGAGALGSLALVALALEGIVCILLAAPLAIPVIMLGGALGRGIAVALLKRRNPTLSVALLPLVLLGQSLLPQQQPIDSLHAIAIDAPPEAVWQALTSPEPIGDSPGLPGFAGLAYPIASHLEGEGVGARRIGEFSTGTAIEEVTAWQPGEALAFRVVDQPPAMEEMSPYRRVHAPHVEGYFLTGETRFEIEPTGAGTTRLSVSSRHLLYLDPVPYWEPIARLAIRENVGRVLQDIRTKAESID